ncbi:MAG: RdgB/HAM1 family non-canonical purine NTP pyrophosphatase [Candidatus Gastranaerophilales bacterium]|nr:RdgB/HAM1 family non-canonical purine NTP pyrophosphatase [Candidatus Gastranaerophilales bacterium]
MYKIVLATANPNKVKEINAITQSLGVEFVLSPEGFDPVEDGETFEQNALIKAKEANRLTNMPALADDSGLCVDALDGKPGIYSCRYAHTPQARIEKLLNELKDVPFEKRGAKFVCAMVLLDKNGDVIFSDKGECFGKIGFEAKGQNGFGYDPVFIVDGNNLTMAELSAEEKNKISHRAAALNKVINFLRTNNFPEALI